MEGLKELSRLLRRIDTLSLKDAAFLAASFRGPLSGSIPSRCRLLERKVWFRIGIRFEEEKSHLPDSDIEQILSAALKAQSEEFFLPLSLESFAILAEKVRDLSQGCTGAQLKFFLESLFGLISDPQSLEQLSRERKLLFRLLDSFPNVTVTALMRVRAHSDRQSQEMAHHLLKVIDFQLQEEGKKIRTELVITSPEELRVVFSDFQCLEQRLKISPGLFARSFAELEKVLPEALREAERIFPRPLLQSFRYRRILLVSIFLALRSVSPLQVRVGSNENVVSAARSRHDQLALFFLSGWILLSQRIKEDIFGMEMEEEKDDVEWTTVLVKAKKEASPERRRRAAEEFFQRLGPDEFLKCLPELVRDLPSEKACQVLFQGRKTRREPKIL